jgi:YidC/Oxa1 family membrane protein insertase
MVPRGGAFLTRTAEVGGTPVPLGEIAYAASDSAIRLDREDAPRTLELRGAAGGRAVVERYRFDPATYVVEYQLELGSGDGVLHTTIGPRLESNEKNPQDDYGALRAVVRVDGEVVTRSPGDTEEENHAFAGAIDWAGLRNKYFLAVLIEPEDGPPLSAMTLRGAPGDSLPALDARVTAPLRGGIARYRIYMGPQEFQRLRALDHGLDDVNQYGWAWIRWMITPFAKLIVVVMLWMHRWIPDYGLVLIVFGVLVRLVMWPLTTKSFKSITEMQKLQPELQRLRESYKKDPQRMQQETMRLYRERKVNPLGGCLPNLIPMPILFALFFVFQSTIEFRGASFLWLPDLSQPDPWYILPILMGLSMLVSSKLTQTDPKMAAMTYVMPIVLTFIFINLAAGLVLYYTVSNVLTFGQQWWLRRGAPLPGTGPPKPA